MAHTVEDNQDGLSSSQQSNVELVKNEALIQESTAQEELADLAIDKDQVIDAGEQIAKLNQQVVELSAKADANWDAAMRSASELANFRTRAERETEKARKFAIEKLLESLLPVMDSLEQAVNALADEETVSGVQLTLKLFLDTLAKYDVVALDPLQEKFDPLVHEAVAMVQQADAEPGVITQVMQKGYLLSGRVVRPARVIVVQ